MANRRAPLRPRQHDGGWGWGGEGWGSPQSSLKAPVGPSHRAGALPAGYADRAVAAVPPCIPQTGTGLRARHRDVPPHRADRLHRLPLRGLSLSAFGFRRPALGSRLSARRERACLRSRRAYLGARCLTAAGVRGRGADCVRSASPSPSTWRPRGPRRRPSGLPPSGQAANTASPSWPGPPGPFPRRSPKEETDVRMVAFSGAKRMH